jgi:polysaccharide export outer membrane protein
MISNKGFAQVTTDPNVRAEAPAEERTGADTRYRIGAGDVLAIIVRKAPELSSDAVRVDQRGMIELPMIKGQLTAACKTEAELSEQIATLYREFKNDPSVQVFVREFQSRPVAVIGSINSPGQFRLQRRVRLLELLSFANGTSERAGRTVEVIHGSGPDICEKPSGEDKDAKPGEGISYYKLSEVLKGLDSANPFVRPGDIVNIPEADVVFVYGHVIQPRAIALKDRQVTVSWAIAMAGGPQRDAQTDRIRIIRQASDGSGGKQEIPVNLPAIEKKNAPDIVLLPNDIVAVGTSTTKTILGILQGAVAPAISQGAIRAIP